MKASIFDGLTPEGVAIINKDTLHSDILIERAKQNTSNVITYSTHDLAQQFVLNLFNIVKAIQL